MARLRNLLARALFVSAHPARVIPGTARSYCRDAAAPDIEVDVLVPYARTDLVAKNACRGQSAQRTATGGWNPSPRYGARRSGRQSRALCGGE